MRGRMVHTLGNRLFPFKKLNGKHQYYFADSFSQTTHIFFGISFCIWSSIWGVLPSYLRFNFCSVSPHNSNYPHRPAQQFLLRSSSGESKLLSFPTTSFSSSSQQPPIPLNSTSQLGLSLNHTQQSELPRKSTMLWLFQELHLEHQLNDSTVSSSEASDMLIYKQVNSKDACQVING